jgi:hypothetical protein
VPRGHGVGIHRLKPAEDVKIVAMVQGGVSGLVTGAVFKTVERQTLPLAGSIPVRLRHTPPDLT